MDDGSEGNRPRASKKDGRFLVVFSAVTVVAVMTIALILASGVLAPRGEDDPQNTDNTSSDASEDKLVSGVASDFILNESDMGSDWTSSAMDINMSQVTEHLEGLGMTSFSGIAFERFNSTGQLEYRIELGVIVFDTIENATAFSNYVWDGNSSFDTSPVLLANVSIGDGGVVLDGPHITLGHEAKWLLFTNKNVYCSISYHHAWTYDPLPNEMLIDLANKVDVKIA